MSLAGKFYEFRKKFSILEKTKENYTRTVSGDDVNFYMENWARRSGLLDFQPDAMRIGWDFPFAISELQNRFGLRGYLILL